jgi:hypothetical protein
VTQPDEARTPDSPNKRHGDALEDVVEDTPDEEADGAE